MAESDDGTESDGVVKSVGVVESVGGEEHDGVGFTEDVVDAELVDATFEMTTAGTMSLLLNIFSGFETSVFGMLTLVLWCLTEVTVGTGGTTKIDCFTGIISRDPWPRIGINESDLKLF